MTSLWFPWQSLRQWKRGVKSDCTVLLRAGGGAAAYGTGEVCQISMKTRLYVVIALRWYLHPIDRGGMQIIQYWWVRSAGSDSGWKRRVTWKDWRSAVVR